MRCIHLIDARTMTMMMRILYQQGNGAALRGAG
jgi:hypothetical protein